MAQLTVTISANDRASAVLQKVQQATAKTHSALESLNSAGSGLSGASSSIKSLNNESSKSPGIFSKMGSALKKTLTIVGGFTVVRGIFDTISSSIGTAISRLDTFDVFERKMKLITGSTEDAKYALEEMTEATTGTAYKLDTAAQSVQNFVTRGMNTKDAVASIKIWMDATSAYGAGTSDQFETVADAIAKMRTKGTVEMRQLNRLFQVGINPVRMYAQAVGMAEADVQEALTHKDIKAEEFLNVVETAMREGTNGVTIVEGMAQKVGTTWAATMTNSRIAVARGVANVIDAVNESFKVIDPDNGLKGIILNMGKSLEGALKTIAEKVKVFLPPIIERLGHLFDFVKQNGTLLITFFGSIAGIVGGFGAFKTASDCINDFRFAWSKLAQAFGKTRIGEALVGEVTSMKKVLTTLPAATESALTVSAATPQQIVAETPYKTKGTPSTAFVTPPMQTVKEEYLSSPILPGITPSVSAKQNPIKNFIEKNKTKTPDKNIVAPLSMGQTGKLPNLREERQLAGEIAPLGNLKDMEQTWAYTTQDVSLLGSTLDTAWSKAKVPKTPASKIAKAPKTSNEPKTYTALKETLDNAWMTVQPQPFQPTGTLKQTLDTSWQKSSISEQYTNPTYQTLGTQLTGAWSQAKKPYPENPTPVKKTTPVSVRLQSAINPKGLSAKDKVAEAVVNNRPTGLKDSMLHGTQNFVKSTGGMLESGLNVGKALLPEGIFDNKLTDKISGFGTGIGKALDTSKTFVANKLVQLSTVFTSFGTTLGNAITNTFSPTLVEGVTSFFSNLLGASLSFIGAVPQLVTGVAAFSLVFAGLGKLNENGEAANGVAAFFETLKAQAANLLVVGQQWIGNLVIGIKSNLPNLVQRGIELVNTTLIGVASALPQMITIGAQLLIEFITGLITTIPTLVSTGFQAIQGFIQGLGMAIPILIQEGWNMILTIGQSIATNLPFIFQAGKDTIHNLVQGIKDTLPVLLENAWNIISSLATTFVQNLPEIIRIGGEIITNLINGISELLPELLTAGADLIVWLITTIVQHLPDMISAGWNLIWSLAQGLWNALPTILQTAGDIMWSLLSAIGNFAGDMWNKALEIGGELINGLWQGINDTWNGLTESVGGFFTGIIDSVKGWLHINSPSKDMIEIGGYVSEGLGQGIQEKMPQVIEDMKGQIDQMIADSRSKIDQLSTDIQAKYAELESNLNAQLESMTNTMNGRWTELTNGAITIMSQFNGTLVSCLDQILNASNGRWEQVSSGMQTIVSRMTGETLKTMSRFVEDIHSLLDPLPSYTNQIGMDMMGQMAKGIDGSKPLVTTTASDLVQQLKSVFEGGLGIHSPSDYMIWVGQMMLAGLMEGMSSSQIQKFIDSVIGDMQTSFANGRFNANELVNFISDDATMNLIGRLSDVDMSNLASMAPETIAYPLIGTRGTQTSWFGHRPSPGGIGSTNHGGVDLAAPTGTPIASALAGNVTTAGWYGGYGNAVVVDSGNGIDITYGHMSQVLARVGQQVSKGQQIGLVGSTGNSTGPHLHFEMHQNGSRIDPQPYIDGGTITGGVAVNPLVAAIQAALAAKNGIFLMGSTSGSGLIEPDWFKNWQPSQAVARWAPYVLQALSILGEPASLLKGVLWAINGESSGNPNDINLWDYNASIGDPTKGLLQIMSANFKPVTQGGWGVPGYTNNIWDPLENILTGLGEMKWKPIYANSGGIAGVINRRLAQGHWSGYAVGTRYVPEDMMAPIHKGEAILPASMNPYTQSGGDYLRDLVTGMIPSGIGNFDIEAIAQSENPSIDFDLGAVSGTGSTNNSQNYDNRNITLNNNYNIDTEAQARLNAHEMERVLHGILNQGIAVGRKGY